jgi:hypothetical protein
MLGRPVMKSLPGTQLWYGNHPGSLGTPYTVDGTIGTVEMEERMKRDLLALPTRTELTVDSVYAAYGWRYISGDPVRYAGLVAARFGYFIWFVPWHQLSNSLLYKVPYVGILLLAILGLAVVVSRRGSLERWLPLAMWGAQGIAYSLIIMLPRYRFPVLSMLILYAGAALARFVPFRRTPAGS